MMTFPTISAGTRANEAIGGYDDFVEYLNALAAGVDTVTTTAAGAALKANNLSDLTDAAAARTALGLGTAAVVDTGTGAANVILGNDTRLTDTRTPTDNTVSTAKIVNSAVTDAKLASAFVEADTIPVGAYSTQLCRPYYTMTASAESADRLDIWPYYIPHDMTIDELSIQVTSGASGGVWRLCFFALDGTLGAPYTLIADLGTITPTSTGVKAITGLSVALTRGWVGFGYVPQSGASGGAMRASYPLNGVSSGTISAPGVNAWQKQSITGAIASTISSWAAIDAYFPPSFIVHRSA